MKFIQKDAQVIWDSEKDCQLAEFKDGIFETNNEEVIAKLEKLGIDYEIPTKIVKNKKDGE